MSSSPAPVAVCLTSLVRLETTVQRPARGTASQHRMHFATAKIRFWLIDVLKRSGDERLAKRSVRLDFCGAFPTVHQADTGPASVRYNLCRDRLCPTCQRLRGIRLKHKLLSVVRNANAPKFVTLTLKHRSEPLSDEITRLFSSFRTLRKDPRWSKRVKGGVYVLEVKLNPATGHWHPHLHCLIDSGYMPQAELSKAWEAATGDSTIVDIRAIHSQEAAAGYISSYATKGNDLTRWTAGNVIEYAKAMHGRRLIHTFGSLHAVPCDDESEENLQQPTRRIASTMHLLHRADVGDFDARFCVSVLSAVDQRWAIAFGIAFAPRPLVPAPPTPAEVERALAWARVVDRRHWHAPPERVTPPKALPHAGLFGVNPARSGAASPGV